MPSLLSLCLKFVDESILNLDNGPFVYDFARSNGFSTLEARAAKFCTESYRGLRAKHGPEVLLESLGTEMFVALETNHNTVEAQRQRISRMGTVLPDGIAPPVQPVRPPQPSPSMAAASAVAHAAPAIAPSAAAPSLAKPQCREASSAEEERNAPCASRQCTRRSGPSLTGGPSTMRASDASHVHASLPSRRLSESKTGGSTARPTLCNNG